MLITLVTFIAILALLVLVHELGHFVVARKNGIKVDEFGFGFPPRIFGIQVFSGRKLEKIAEKEEITITEEVGENEEIVKEVIVDQKKEIDQLVSVKKWRWVWGGRTLDKESVPADLTGGTIYSVNWIPLGGFVKIKGEDGEFAEDKDSFGAKKIWQRVLVLVAGVAMNFILAAVLLGIGLMIGLPQSLDSVGKGAIIKDPKIEIVNVLSKSPAEEAGVQVGDQVFSLDEKILLNVSELQNYVDIKKDQPIKFVFKRSNEFKELEIAPRELSETKKGGIGVALVESGIVSYSWYRALPQGFTDAGIMTWEILRSFGKLFVELFHGNGNLASQLSGPVGIAVLTGRVARLGLNYLLQFAALLSLNLVIINILPLPALDGGRVLFLILEKLRGRPLRRQLENIIHTTGFALLMLLVVVVTYRDVMRFSGSFLKLGKKLIGG